MKRMESLGHRPLSSAASSISTEGSARLPYTPPAMERGPLAFNAKVCYHATTDELPCARRIIKTIKTPDSVTHQWISCQGTRFVSTTMPLTHGVDLEQVRRDAAALGHGPPRGYYGDTPSPRSTPSV